MNMNKKKDFSQKIKVESFEIFVVEEFLSIKFKLLDKNGFVYLICKNIRNINLIDIENIFNQEIVIVFQNKSNDQLDDINWYVQDSEDEKFSFYCKEIEMK